MLAGSMRKGDPDTCVPLGENADLPQDRATHGKDPLCGTKRARASPKLGRDRWMLAASQGQEAGQSPEQPGGLAGIGDLGFATQHVIINSSSEELAHSWGIWEWSDHCPGLGFSREGE